MRITRSLPYTLTALAAAGALAFGVAPTADGTAPDLETVPYMTTDAAGDGNLTNGQGLADDTVPTTSTGPAQVAEADILGARITSLYESVVGDDGLVDNVLTGVEFRTALSGEPTVAGAPLIHRFMGNAGGCRFWVQAYTGTGPISQAHGTANVRIFDASCGVDVDPDDPLGGDETLSGDWVTWSWDAEYGEMVVTLDLAAADARIGSRFVPGEYYILDSLANRLNTGVITAPVFDEATDGGYALIGADVPADEEPAEDGTATPTDGDPEPSPSPEA